MCALSIASANGSRGEAMAIHKIAIADKKALSRHWGNCAGRVLRIASHPLQYTSEGMRIDAESQ
jgi:hypothetical protein